MNLGKYIQLFRQELEFLFRDAVINTVIGSYLIPRLLRAPLLHLVGHKGVSPRALVSAGVFLGSRTGLTLGRGAIINYGSFLDLGAPITIGEYAGLGYRCMLITCGHEIGSPAQRYGTADNKSIVIGDGAWVSAGVTVMPGVTIGAGCVIGAGAVVTRDCVPNGVYLGAPARLIRMLDDAEPRSELPTDV